MGTSSGGSRPERLVMINSGKFSYAEVDLSSPLHLVGQNNVGKTTLISTLQFLYIVNQKQMSFSRSMDETRRYYFPDTKSYILFECVTSTGYMVMGVRGLGVLKGNEFERFVYRGGYEKSDFIHSETGEVKSFDEIARDLSTRDYCPLKPHELRDSLTGTGRGNVPVLGIVPVKNRNDYEKFRKIFRNLLHLAHLSQEDLKKFLIDVNGADLKRTEVDLAKEFSEAYRKVKRNAMELSTLKAHSETVLKVLELDVKRRELNKELPHLYAALLTALEIDRGVLRRKIENIDDLFAEVNSEKKQLHLQLKAFSRSVSDYNRKTGSLETRLDDFSELEKSLSDYLSDFEESSIISLKSHLTEVQISLRDAAEGDTERTQRRIAESEERYLEFSEQLKNIENLAISGLPNLSPDALSALRLFNGKLLRLPRGPKGIEIENVERFLTELVSLGSRIQEDCYVHENIHISLSSVPEPDLNSLTDRKDLCSRIADLSDTLEKEKRVLQAIREREKLESEKRGLELELAGKEERRSRWRDYQQKVDIADDWKEELAAVTMALKDAEENRLKAQLRLSSLEEQENFYQRDMERIKSNLKRLDTSFSRIPEPEDSWTEVGVLETDRDSLELIDSFFEKYGYRNGLSVRIKDSLSALENDTYEQYSAANEAETLKKLQADIDAIGEKEEALKKLWSGLASSVSQAMKQLLSSLDSLKEKINRLNTRLSKVSVSDLRQLKLVLSENRTWTQLVKEGMEADEMPLFFDRKKVEKALESLGSLLENSRGGKIELRDMFNLNFEIHDVAGNIRRFGKLENIESNGTTITIKVLVNLILLRDLLPHGKAQIPFYLDEASSLDRDNLASVVDIAFEMGFPAVLASPEAMDVASRIYIMKDTGGKVYLDPSMSCIEVNRPTARNPGAGNELD